MSFHERVRALLDERGMSFAELASAAELDASIVSRLLAESESMRREPRLEHVLAIARAFEMSPGELVSGTSAQDVLGAWVQRTELEREVAARMTSQTEAANLRTEMAGMRAQVATLNAYVAQLMQRATDAEATLHRERVVRAGAEAQRDAATVERDHALTLASTNYRAWANARTRVTQLQRATLDARNSARTGWAAALIGGMAAAVLASEANEPQRRSSTTRRRRTRRK
jgi:transcriptional regulator with XRE-family HTH domain